MVEHAVLQISENSRRKFIEQTLERGFQQTVAEIYRFGAEVVQGGKMEEAGRVAERYFALWRDLDIS